MIEIVEWVLRLPIRGSLADLEIALGIVKVRPEETSLPTWSRSPKVNARRMNNGGPTVVGWSTYGSLNSIHGFASGFWQTEDQEVCLGDCIPRPR